MHTSLVEHGSHGQQHSYMFACYRIFRCAHTIGWPNTIGHRSVRHRIHDPWMRLFVYLSKQLTPPPAFETLIKIYPNADPCPMLTNVFSMVRGSRYLANVVLFSHPVVPKRGKLANNNHIRQIRIDYSLLSSHFSHRIMLSCTFINTSSCYHSLILSVHCVAVAYLCWMCRASPL